MTIHPLNHSDFQQIIDEIADFWGSDRTMTFHHPMFLYEFGNSAFVIRKSNRVVAYLFGFLSQTEKTGYVHLIGVRKSAQGNGMGTALYTYFTDFARAQGCTKLKAITTPSNEASIAFHCKFGMQLLGEPNENGLSIVKDYSGKGQDRVVFVKEI